MPEAKMPEDLARLYHVVNVAHPFREGNGRTQREFLIALAAESGHTVDWRQTTGPINDHASLRARQGDLEPLTRMFAVIVTRAQPSATSTGLTDAMTAFYPAHAAQATAGDTGWAQGVAYRPVQQGCPPGVERS